MIRRSSASGTGPYTAAVGNWSFANFRTAVTVKTAIVPSARPTYTRSPGCSVRSQKKIPGPERESTWPAMTAAPTVPGRGLPVYQPATAVLDGTWSVPFPRRPRSTSEVRTPIAGMLSQTGRAACWAVASDAGSTVRPDGAGIGDGLAGRCAAYSGESAAAAKPVVPTATATSPAPSATAASRRGEIRRSQGRCRDVHRPRVAARTFAHDGGGFGGYVWG